MKTFVIVDGLNTFFRAANSVNPQFGLDAQAGMALHTLINSMNSCWKQFHAEHMVFCTEGRSWRKDAYAEYKLNRVIANLKLTEEEKADSAVLMEVFNDFSTFIKEDTNVTYLRCPTAEADDMIATWVQTHVNDKHVIISSDSDFVQLLSNPNVWIYDPINERLLHQTEILNKKNKRVEFEIKSDGKIKVGIENPNFVPEYANWYEFALFVKIIRGDKSDNIMSAYPGARFKGTKNKIGITEAFNDISNKGFTWNNFMLQRYTDHHNNEVTVKEMYDRNMELIDLTSQPQHIKDSCNQILLESIKTESVSNLGFKFLQLCGRWKLNKIADNMNNYTKMFNSGYQ